MPQSATANINNQFFDGIYKEVWKKLIPPGLSEAEVDFIIEASALKEGDQLLDLMCGYGRHALEAARRGIVVTAIDNSQAYIDEIKIRSEQDSLNVKAILSGIEEAELQGTYKAAICMGNSFAFFDKGEALDILNKIAGCLVKGGTFIINTWMIAEIAIRHFREKDWFYIDGYKYLSDNEFLLNPSRIETSHIIIADDGTTESIKGIDYILTISELNDLFRSAGLQLKEIYSTPRKKRFRLGDTRAYIIAVKS
jgi:cyclopropane fatty-acyl-phospholipid synthase-like methyltransferase